MPRWKIWDQMKKIDVGTKNWELTINCKSGFFGKLGFNQQKWWKMGIQVATNEGIHDINLDFINQLLQYSSCDQNKDCGRNQQKWIYWRLKLKREFLILWIFVDNGTDLQ